MNTNKQSMLDHYYEYLASKQQWLLNVMVDSYDPNTFELFNSIELDRFIHHIETFDLYASFQFKSLFKDTEFLNKSFEIGILLHILHVLPTKFIQTLKVSKEYTREDSICFVSTVREDLTVTFTSHSIKFVVQNDKILAEYTFSSYIQNEDISVFLKLDDLFLPE